MEFSPAILKTATWDVVGWNKAAAVLLTDYSQLPPEQRNILRLMFGGSRIRARREDWREVARFVVGAFRADVARAGAGASDEVSRLVEELCRLSPEFGALWRDNDVVARGEGIKCIRHPEAGHLDLEFSSFAVEGRPDLKHDRLQPGVDGGGRARPSAHPCEARVMRHTSVLTVERFAALFTRSHSHRPSSSRQLASSGHTWM